MYVFPMYFNVIISYSFTTAIPLPPPQTTEETWTTNLSPAILNIFHLFLTSTHRCPRFKPPCDTDVICSSNYYLLNMMSVTKNSSQNQLQQVEMRLRHVYSHRTCNTMWSTAHASCIILWTFEAISLALRWRPLHTLLEIKGPRDMNYIQSQ